MGRRLHDDVGRTSCQRGADLIGATRDVNFPMPYGLWPGSGAVLAAIEVAAERKASTVVGNAFAVASAAATSL